MAKTFELTATQRKSASNKKILGKGPSKLLRRENKIPAVLYGGEKEKAPLHICVEKQALDKVMKDKAFYFSLLTLHIDGAKETALLKALQRHPIDSSKILHLDFLRVNPNQQITFHVPLRFIGEEESVGVKEGGMVSHLMSDLEIKCLVKNLPESIEVDLSNVGLESTIHLSDLKLPKGIELASPITSSDDDSPVVSIHKPKAEVIAPVEVAAAEPTPESAPAAEQPAA